MPVYETSFIAYIFPINSVEGLIVFIPGFQFIGQTFPLFSSTNLAACNFLINSSELLPILLS